MVRQSALLLSAVVLLSLSCRNFGNFWESPAKKDSETKADLVAPTVPTGFNAVQGGSTQINLNWTAATDETTIQSAIVYEVCQSLAAGICNTFTVSYTTPAGAVVFAATGLTASTTYFYRIRAKDAAGNASAASTEVSATTGAPGTVNDPVFAPAAGTYNVTQNVGITTSTGGAIICYTTDTSAPACDGPKTGCTAPASLYSTTISLPTTTTLRAIACLAANTDSAITTGVYTIDSVAPTITNVTSLLADGTYGLGQTVSVQVTFSEVVNVTGTPQINIATGSPAITPANYISGSGSTTLTFGYVVASGNISGDLDYANTTALTLNGGTILDPAGNAAILTLAAPGAAGSLGGNKALVIDAQQPAVTSVTAANADGNFGVGSVIVIQVQFSEVVTVTGLPTLDVATGSPAVTPVSYTSGSGTNTLVFHYNVVAGNASADLDYASATALNLNGGTIRDATLNNALLTLVPPAAAGSLGANKALVIDGSQPTVINVTSTTTNGLYGVGANINVQVVFSEAVYVGGTPQINLSTITPTMTPANYTTGGGTATLNFSYTVAPGNSNADLDYNSSGALILAGGSIQDASGNTAILNLPAPGAAGSLGANKAISIDTAPPTILSAATLDLNNNGKIDAYRITFSEAVLDSTFPGYLNNAIGGVTGSWAVAGYSNVRLIHGTQVSVMSSGFFTDTANDPVLYIAFDENAGVCNSGLQIGCDTGTKPDLTMPGSGLTDMANNPLAVFGAGGVIEADNAPPKLMGTAVPNNVTVQIVLSENVASATAECGPGSSQPGVSCATRYTINNGLTVNSAIMLGGAGVNGPVIVLTTSLQSMSTLYTITIGSGIVQDLAGQAITVPNNTVTFTGVI